VIIIGVLLRIKVITLLLLSLLTGCFEKGSLNISGEGGFLSKISGTVFPLKGLLSSQIAALGSCSIHSTLVQLHKLDQNGEPESAPIATTKLDLDANYSFPSNTVSDLGEEIEYIIKVTGCSTEYVRPITEKNNQQNIDVTSTSTFHVLNSGVTKKITSVKRTNFKVVSTNFTGLDKQQAFEKVDATPSLKTEVTNTIGEVTILPQAFITHSTTAYAGAAVANFTYKITDPSNIVDSVDLKFTTDGTTYSQAKVLAEGGTSDSFTLPTTDTVLANFKIKVTHSTTDNIESSSTPSFKIDNTAPVIVVTSPTNSGFINIANESSIVISGTCTEDGNINLTGSLTETIACASNNFSITRDFSGLGEGAVTLNFDQTDGVGNTATQVSYSLTKDTIAPNLTQTTHTSATLFNTDTINIGGACESGINIVITGSESSSSTCTTSAWAHTTSPKSTDGVHNYTLTHTDPAGNVSSTTLNWIRHTIAPSMTSLNINSGSTTTGNNNVLVDIVATSSISKIDSLCIKYNISTTPLVADSCWKTLTSIGETNTFNFALSSYPFLIGAIIGNYDVHVWLKDELGNISTLSNAGGGTLNQDKYTMNYSPDSPPIMTDLIATASDSPNSPLTSVDTTIGFGNDVYIKWKITDNNPIPAGNISLHVSTDGTIFNPIIPAANLNNSINGICTLTGGYSGCYKWALSSPSSNYFIIKLLVQDSGVSQVFELTNPINTGSVNFLSGNTNLGIGGSASSSILISPDESAYNDNPDSQALAVTKSGYVFFKYHNKGVVYISPEDGLLKTLLEDTNSSTGDGGSVFNATANSVYRIMLDYDENLIVYDSGRLRKIDFSTTPWSINTIAGGGANPPENENALLASLPSINGSIVPMPDGKLYFPSTKDMWYLDNADGKLKKALTVSGLGTDNMSGDRAIFDNTACSTYDLSITFDKSNSTITKAVSKVRTTTTSTCGSHSYNYTGFNTNFNPVTGVAIAPHPPQTSWSSEKFTGLDGKMYNLNQGRTYLQVYNPATNVWDNVIGNGLPGRCPDNTPALSCQAIIMSAFVNEFGKVYFLDMGVIRFIDASGNIQTLAGQPRNFGVGFDPKSARYSQINFFDIDGDDVYIKNKLENQIVKFSLTGGNLEHIAGNSVQGYSSDGADAKTVPLKNCGWGMPCGFKIDSVNNRLYHANYLGSPAYIDLATGNWVTTGVYTHTTGTRISYIGSNGPKLLIYAPHHFGSSGNEVTIDELTTLDNSINAILGRRDIRTPLNTYICDGAVGTTCTLSHTMQPTVQTQASFDSTDSEWIVGYKGKSIVSHIPEGGGTVNNYETLANTYTAFDYYRNGVNKTIFYCSMSGLLFKRDVVNDTETPLTLPNANMKCAGDAIQYHSVRDSLIFIYQENGMYGIAEYKNP
jgi:hypothetical protein